MGVGLKVAVGGPAYRMECDVRHAGAMIGLVTALHSAGAREVTVEYEHGCPVEMPRNKLFRRALDRGSDALIWADSDVFWDDSDDLVWAIGELVTQGEAFLAVPVQQRNDRWNVILSAELDRLENLDDYLPTSHEFRECWAAGLALSLFNLRWYRESWSVGPHFRTDWVSLPTRRELTFLSEDIWHTSRLRHYKGRALWAPLCQTHHAARGGL
jgi:hypothetical protein